MITIQQQQKSEGGAITPINKNTEPELKCTLHNELHKVITILMACFKL